MSVSIVLGLMPLACMAAEGISPTPEMRAARQRAIGIEIGRAGDYVAYSPQATSGAMCPPAYREPAAAPTEAQMQQYRNAVLAAKKKISDEFFRRDAILTAPLHALQKEASQRPMDAAEYERRSKPIHAERAKLAAWRRAEEKRVDEELYFRPLRGAMRSLLINLEHAPTDPNATIVPLDAQFLPTARFVAELSRATASFLKSCGDSDAVVVAHYYRDLFPNGAPNDGEPPITSFRYALSAGALRLTETNPGTEAFLAFHDPSRNPKLRLAVLKDLVEVRLAETSRLKAEYRADFSHASRRKPGVVYKLDEFWARYPNSDLARRIFDGDFARYSSTINFKWLYLEYGNYFSHVCKSHVKSWTTLFEPVSEPDGTVDNPVTGLPETRYRHGVEPVRIDSRFAPHYNDYWAAMRIYGLQQIADKVKNGPRFATMTTSQFFALVPTFGPSLLPESLDSRFFENHSCDSATMIQLGDNLARAARGQPSLQTAGMRLPNAERESDPATLP